MADGSVVVDILADTSDFKSKVASLGKEASSALNSAGGALASAGKAITTAVTVPLVAAVGAAATWGVKTASAAEQAEIAFTTMLGSTKAAQDMMQKLADFAKKTPFELSGLTTATQKLMAYGFAAEDVIPMLSSVGNAAAALGSGQQGIDSITRALGQMQAKGKASAEEMLQLTEAGVPAWQMLADAVSGGDVSKAMDMVTKGAIDSKTAITALQEGMDKRFGGMMEQQAMTLTGVLSNMGDAAEGAVRSLYKSDAWANLTKALSGLSDQIGPFVEKLMPSAEALLGFITSKVEDLTGWLASLSQQDVTNLVNSLGALAALGPSLILMGKSLQVAGTFIGILSKAAGTVSKITGSLSSVGSSLGKALEKPLQKLKDTASANMSAYTGVIGQNLKDAAAKAVNFATDMGKAGGDALKGFASQAKTSLSNDIKDLVTTIKTKSSSIWNGFVDGGGISGAIARGFQSGKAAAESGLYTLGATVKNGAASAFDGIKSMPQTISSAVGSATSVLKGVASKVAGALSGMGSAVSNAIKGVPDAIKTGLGRAATLASDGINGIKAAFGDAASGIGGAAKAAAGAVKGAFGNIGAILSSGGLPALEKAGWGSLGAVVAKGVGDAKSTLGGFAGAVGNAFGAIKESTGGLLSSLKGGLQNFASTVKNGVVGAISNAKELIVQNWDQIKAGLQSVGTMGINAGKGVSVGMLAAGAGVAALAAALGGALLAAASTGADLSQLGASAQNYINSIGATIMGTISSLSAAVPHVVGFLQEQAPAIVASALAMCQQVLDAIVAFLPQLGEVFSAALPIVIQTLVGLLPMVIEAGLMLFSGLIDGLAQAITALTESLPDIMAGMGEAFAAYAPNLMASCQALFDALLQAFPVVVQQLVAALPGFLQWIVDALPGFVGNLFNGAITLFSTLAQALPQVIPMVIAALGQLLLNLITTLPSWGPRFISGMFNLILSLVTGIGQAVGNVGQAMWDLINQAKDKIVNTDWISLGRNIIDGIVNGIKAIGANIANCIGGFVNDAIAGAKSLLGIASPSKVFKRIGRWTVEGFEIGVNDRQDQALRTMRAFTDGVLGEGSRIDGITTTMDSKLNKTVQASAEVSANGIYRSLSDRVDSMAERLEKAMTRPVDINYNGREFGRMVKEALPQS